MIDNEIQTEIKRVDSNAGCGFLLAVVLWFMLLCYSVIAIKDMQYRIGVLGHRIGVLEDKVKKDVSK